jgi:hypothetical protein
MYQHTDLDKKIKKKMNPPKYFSHAGIKKPLSRQNSDPYRRYKGPENPPFRPSLLSESQYIHDEASLRRSSLQGSAYRIKEASPISRQHGSFLCFSKAASAAIAGLAVYFIVTRFLNL